MILAARRHLRLSLSAAIAAALAGVIAPAALGQAAATAPSATPASATSTAPAAPAAPDAAVDMPMHTDPALPTAPPPLEFHPRLLGLWLEALARPDAETRRAAAEAIAQAVPLGLPNAREQAAGPLLQALDAANQHPLVKIACVRALIAMDHRPAAASLLAHAEADGLETALLVDPALVAWNYPPARAAWLARLKTPQKARQAALSALASLAAVRDPAVAEPARVLYRDVTGDPALRLAAARTAAAVADANLEDARTLYAAPNAHVTNRIIAATLLSRGTGGGAEELLLTIARDAEPAVQAIALARLVETSPAKLAPSNAALAGSADVNIRLLAVAALRGQATPAAVPALAAILDDVNVKVRTAARQALIALDANADLRPVIRRELIAALPHASWRVPEQAALALGTLGERAAADGIVLLLDAPRVDVRIAAAVALRRIGLPETAPAVLARARKAAEPLPNVGPGQLTPAVQHERQHSDAELAQLVQTLGRLQYAEAKAFLVGMVPKSAKAGAQAREAACWAIGQIEAIRRDPAVMSQLAQRASDSALQPPELDEVRYASAVALGRAGDKRHLATLRKLITSEPAPHKVMVAAQWAIKQISGVEEPFPPNRSLGPGWFLEPR